MSGRLAGFAFARPHVLVVPGPGGTPVRLQVEALAREWGWPMASTPADADVLALCGTVDGELVDAVAQATSGPVEVVRLGCSPQEVADALDDARRRLLERAQGLAAIRAPAAEGSGAEDARREPSGGQDAERGRHGDHDHDHDHHRHDHDHDGDHGGMEMPGGLAMADRSEDRDGLKLDVLHVPFGPVLAGWPPGLGVVLQLQGDVVQQVEVDPGRTGSGRRSWWDEPWWQALEGVEVPVAVAERRRAACHLDSLGRLLWVAGDEGAAVTIRRLRDATLGGADAGTLRQGVAGVRRRLDRWRLLHRVTAGSGRLDADLGRRLGVTGPALRAAGEVADRRAGSAGYPGFEPVTVGTDGDVRTRWRQWLAEAELALRWVERGGGVVEPVDGEVEGPRGVLGAGDADRSPSAALLSAIEELLPGQELAAARLTVASLDPDAEAELGPQDGDAGVS